MKKQLKLPGIGLRNLKTALGVFVCLLLYDLFDRPHAFFACISVIICLAPTIQMSYQVSKDRMIGTIVGGLLGIPFLYLKNLLHGMMDLFAMEAIIICAGVVLVIYLLNVINNKGAITNACVVFLSVLISLEEGLQQISPLAYSFNRVVDSAIGIAVALVINKYFFPFQEQQNSAKGSF